MHGSIDPRGWKTLTRGVTCRCAGVQASWRLWTSDEDATLIDRIEAAALIENNRRHATFLPSFSCVSATGERGAPKAYPGQKEWKGHVPDRSDFPGTHNGFPDAFPPAREPCGMFLRAHQRGGAADVQQLPRNPTKLRTACS
jgi:hypothetical protein